MMLMGSEYNTKKDYVVMQTESTETHIFTVNTPEQAVELAEGPDTVVIDTSAKLSHIELTGEGEITADAGVSLAKLAQQGFGAIEVCGAFGKELAERMFHATGERVSVGYVVCPQEQKELSDRFWSQP